MSGQSTQMIVRALKAKGNNRLAYQLLRKQYEQGDMEGLGSLEQINLLVDLAEVSMSVGNKAKCSIPYIDEALILVQNMNEVREEWYTELQDLRAYYVQRAMA
ncbi:MAG: hypothetical protein ACRCTE_02835 [Cellulosilyticaceae bacterium]